MQDEFTVIIRASVPNPHKKPELNELVKTYQAHHNSKTCRKYRNEKCRFYFDKFFTNHTTIAELLTRGLISGLLLVPNF